MSGPRVFYPLPVLDTREEIDGQAKTVMFDVPSALSETFTWRPGQHLQIRLLVNGEELRRCYSISSSPHTGDPLRITVKRVENGVVSQYINNRITRGDILEVMPANGSFTLDCHETARRTHYFLGAGSGITPLFSMLSSVLAAESNSFVHLLYGNRNEKTVLLADELGVLLKRYPERMTLHHVLSKPGWWSATDYWRSGILDRKTVEAWIEENPPYAQDCQYYLCGPGGMNEAVTAALRGLDVPLSRIHQESYGGTSGPGSIVEGVAAAARISIGGSEQVVSIEAGQTVLQAARAAGLELPFSCQAGVCGSCRARLTDGVVHMRSRAALSDAEIDRASILSCQSVPTTDKIALMFD